MRGNGGENVVVNDVLADIPAILHPQGTRPLHHLLSHRRSRVPLDLARIPFMSTVPRDRSSERACITCLPCITYLENILGQSRRAAACAP